MEREKSRKGKEWLNSMKMRKKAEAEYMIVVQQDDSVNLEDSFCGNLLSWVQGDGNVFLDLNGHTLN